MFPADLASAAFRARDMSTVERCETTESQVDNRDIALQRVCALERMFKRAISQHFSVCENFSSPFVVDCGGLAGKSKEKQWYDSSSVAGARLAAM